MNSGLLLVTRHLPVPHNEFATRHKLPGREEATYVPSGVILDRPWPEARVLFIEVKDRYYYIYWIDTRLMVAQGEST